MAFVLPNGIVETKLFPAFERLRPEFGVLVPKNPTAVILRLEHIDAGFADHDQIDFDYPSKKE